MKIDFSRSGGFGGLQLRASVDTAELSAERAAEVEVLVERASFFDLAENSRPAAPVPDTFEYRVAISGAPHGTHAIVMAEGSVPAKLRPLLDYLTGLALKREDRHGHTRTSK